MENIQRKRKNLLFIVIVLVILVLLEANYIVDINEQLDDVLSELTKLKSEDSSLLESKMLFEDDSDSNSDNNELDNQKSEIPVTKPTKEKIIFFQLKPKINLRTLKSKYKKFIIPKFSKQLTVADKKRNFTKLMLPIIKKSRMELLHLYNKIENYQNKELSIQEEIILNKLFDKYKISNREINSLLLAIKPHPTSLVLAQAAMESGWGSSRFFQTGNNVFGIWSFDNKDDRIKAKFNKKVYLKKYDSLKESVSDYFLILGRVSNYKEFRELRKSTNNSYKLAEKLSNYSQSENYVKKLQIIIRVNKFTQYD